MVAELVIDTVRRVATAAEGSNDASHSVELGTPRPRGVMT